MTVIGNILWFLFGGLIGGLHGCWPDACGV